MRIEVTDQPVAADDQFVIDQTRQYNHQYMESGFQLLSCYFRDGEQNIVAGLTGKIYWGWLHVEYLWVAEAERGKDLGSKLLAAAEAEAVNRGCVGSQLDTFSFQAPEFYRKQGYSVMGSLSGYFNNSQRIFLQKSLPATASVSAPTSVPGQASEAVEPPLSYSALYPELLVQNVENSRKFYVNILGFKLEYARPEENFYYLSYGAAQIMLLQDNANEHSRTGSCDYPRGQGVNFSIVTDSVYHLEQSLANHKIPLRIPVREQWHRRDHKLVGEKQLWVMDPDGYLLRFIESLGTRPA